MNLSEILSRLGVKGATKVAGDPAFDNYLPILGSDGKLDVSLIPAISLDNLIVVADQAARLALTTLQVQPGDFARQTDNGVTYILTVPDPSIDGNWIPMGDSAITATDVAFTPAGDIAATDVQTALQEVDNEKVGTDTADTITAVHTFNPSAPTAPIILGANAIDQLVTGLNADKLDGLDNSDFIHKDGTQAFTADQSIQNFKLIDVGTPTLGTDAANKDYVDTAVAGASPQLQKQILFNGVFYSDIQTAYDAAYLLATPTNPMEILIGAGIASDFGDITLVADFSPYVSLTGLGTNISGIGTINANNTLDGFVVDLHCSGLSITAINTFTTDATNAFNGGNIAVAADSAVVIGSINTAADTGVNAGNVSLGGPIIVGDIIASAATTPGAMTLTGVQCGSLFLGPTGAAVAAKDTTFAASSGFPCINFLLGSGSKFVNCNFSTADTDQNCIDDLTSSSAQFADCIFIPNGSGDSINSTTPQSVLGYNVLMKNDVDANVTYAGTRIVDASLALF